MAVKIAASTYLNSAPLVYGFAQGNERRNCQFIGDAAPSRCADLLAKRSVAAALIPSIEYQRIDNIIIVPDIAVAAKQSVRSVLLVSRVPLEQISSIALDTCSRTSATLVRVLMEYYYQLRPRFATFSPSLVDMLESHDAALIIGDPAMAVDQHAFYVYDLAEEWRKFTGHPFVFALWAVDVELAGVADFSGLCAASKREGIDALAEIADQYSAQLNISQVSLLDYLTTNINYDLDAENRAGLQRFYELAAGAGLIEGVRPLQFLDVK